MRYLKQRQGNTCVPVMLINLFKWKGGKHTEKSCLSFWKEVLKCGKNGCNLRRYGKLLKDMHLRVRNNPPIEEIESQLKRKKAVIVRSGWVEDGVMHGHVFLVVDRDRHRFLCINAGENTEEWITKSVFKKAFLQKMGNYPKVWYAKKS